MTFRQPNNKEYLINERFKNAGYFELINRSLTLVLNNLNNVEPAVYALVSGTEALYIGKTKNQVKVQLNRLREPDSEQKTNIRIHHNLVELIPQTGEVEIMVWFDNSLKKDNVEHLKKLSEYKKFLIQELKPRWNLQYLK